MRISAVIFTAAAVIALAAPAFAQPGYPQDDQSGGGRAGYGQNGYGQNGDGRSGYPDRRGGQGDSDGYRDEQPDSGSATGRPPGGADYADADQAPPDLGRELGLRAEQRQALQAYQQATTPSNAEQQQTQADMRRLQGMTTPQRLDFTAQQMQRDQADFGRRAAAVRRFYGQLTPSQQRRFDQLTGPEQDTDDQGGAQGQAFGQRPLPPR